MMRTILFPAVVSALSLVIISCSGGKSTKEVDSERTGAFTGTNGEVKIMTLDPGHFHAALVQKSMYEGIDSLVHIYAPEGAEVKQHLDLIHSFNTREENPTNWEEKVYTGNDYLERMLSEKAGNVVVLAGNNKKKTEYILKSLEAGFNVLADKPMAININGFEMLKKAFEVADENSLLLYDLMTERYEITTILQRELSMLSEVFGKLESGSVEYPAVTKESVHHFYKYVSGNVLTRPAWFMDESQEGDGIVDVTTHLVDLIQWECFPEQIIDYTKDIRLNTVKRWTTEMSLREFMKITKLESYPDYLNKNIINDTMLIVHCNGEINYQLFGVHAKVSVEWAYRAPEGIGDTHYSIMRGTKSNLIIRQGIEEKFIPTLYIEPLGNYTSYENVLLDQFKLIQNKYPGVELRKTDKGWMVFIPEQYREGHEAHFAQVTQKFLKSLRSGTIPGWEVPNMIAKYYTTTHALELAKQNEPFNH